MSIKLHQVTLQTEQPDSNTPVNCLSIPQLEIHPDQHWAFFCAKGDAGSVFAQLLVNGKGLGEQADITGEISGLPEKISSVSLAQQQVLLEEELANDDTDFLDRLDKGTSVEELIVANCDDTEQAENLLTLLDLQGLRYSGFRHLSTGETRRVMFARALAEQPQLLILEDPLAGLDIAHQKQLISLIEQLHQDLQVILITSREQALPDSITHVGVFDEEKLTGIYPRSEWESLPLLAHLRAQSSERSEAMLALIQQYQHQTQMANPLIAIRNGKVEYTDKLIFDEVNWQINNHEHWQIRGANGCGKSTLLGLIFGDHPQCYSNDIEIFGIKRGSGETIWDIKQHIGMVSSAFHLQYRVSCSALDTILSGFYDSIGLYQQPSIEEIKQARDWLALLHMSHLASTSFKQLEYGQQRLLLVARALIKRPKLLILDEPYQGLDFLNRQLVKNALEMIAKNQLSQLLYVSHHPEDALDCIRNFVDFVGSAETGYKTIITHNKP
ncbi:molybdate ABC transporter ATP-binding protein ModF [Photobacterium sp. DNB23_23_1]|uniref:Molybdate ABC transporter ATP-binding protein ModF n=1 Tax=Photobacterium pectinilyticum TaxID=2906793 RepID=A0ABT1N9N5_9GAMM|nr:molybdate ABC transporter ATP-binding protein ModF [Photobacterium sp. ZSDE20]MCQ1060569.1 molybdate ABC transporter ATP-binding protein ModF [Photobacterium sp. ZSDE20]MDD1828087.1 molybdate ABC transporter ATP-binding protein ModF [Photobacterium sp. ZSDE20]